MTRIRTAWPWALAALALHTPARPAAEPPESRAVPSSVEVVRIIGGTDALDRGFWQRLAGAEAEPLFARPYGVAWTGDDLLVADPARGAVLRIDRKDRAARSAPGLFTAPIGIAACDAGIVVTDSTAGTVTLLDRELRRVRELRAGLARPTGVACVDGGVYVVETAAHRVLVLDDRGNERGRFGGRGSAIAELNYPVALAATAADLWIGDTLNFRVQRWRSSDGQFLGSWGRIGDAPGDTPRIKGIAVDQENDRIWLTDAHLDRIAVFGGSGALLAEIGTPGSQPGQFSFPAGIALHRDGRVAVADSLNRRVQILRLRYERGSGAERGGAER